MTVRIVLIFIFSLFSTFGFGSLPQWFIKAERHQAEMQFLFFLSVIRSNGTIAGSTLNSDDIEASRKVLDEYLDIIIKLAGSDLDPEERAKLAFEGTEILRLANFKRLNLISENEEKVFNRVMNEYDEMLELNIFEDDERREFEQRKIVKRHIETYISAHAQEPSFIDDLSLEKVMKLWMWLRINSINSREVETFLSQRNIDTAAKLSRIRWIDGALKMTGWSITLLTVASATTHGFFNPFGLNTMQFILASLGIGVVGLSTSWLGVDYLRETLRRKAIVDALRSEVMAAGLYGELRGTVQKNFQAAARILGEEVEQKAKELNIDLATDKGRLASIMRNFLALDISRLPCFQTVVQ